MQEQKYQELEERVTRLSEDAIPEGLANALFRKLEQRQRIHQEIEAMRSEGKAYTLTEEEISMIESFRRFKLRMRKDGEIFSDLMFPIAYADKYTGTLIDTDFGHNMWVQIDQAIINESDPKDSIKAIRIALEAIRDKKIKKLDYYFTEEVLTR